MSRVLVANKWVVSGAVVATNIMLMKQNIAEDMDEKLCGYAWLVRFLYAKWNDMMANVALNYSTRPKNCSIHAVLLHRKDFS